MKLPDSFKPPKQRFLITLDVEPGKDFVHITDKKKFKDEGKNLANGLNGGKVNFAQDGEVSEIGQVKAATVRRWLGNLTKGQAVVAVISGILLVIALMLSFLGGDMTTNLVINCLIFLGSLAYLVVDLSRGFSKTSLPAALLAVYSVAASAVSVIEGVQKLS